MTLQVNKGAKYFGADRIFEDLNFEIKPNEKIAIIGRNGCGKTTLLKCIAGEYTLDKGQLFFPKELNLGYLSQSNIPVVDTSVRAYLLELYQELFELEKQMNEAAENLSHHASEKQLEDYASIQHDYERLGGYTYHQEMMTMVTQFGFKDDDLDRSLATFSGGEKTRIAFIRLLLSKPDILLLDEPTNHLDMSTIEWLEGYLAHYPKALVFVSHDRMFIDRIAKIVYEMDDGELTRYVGNYSTYLTQKALNLEKQASAYKRQQKDIERLEVLIEKFRYKKNKAKFAQSKIKYLDRMERIDAPENDHRSFKANFHSRIKGGKHVFTCKDLAIGYTSTLATLSFELMHGVHTAVIGPNGQGKSTFLKTILGKHPALSGEMLWGHQIEIGYFDQEQVEYTSQRTVLEDLWDAYPLLTQTEIRTILGSFLFTADEVFKEVRILSGGEKVRLALAKLMLQEANCLVLDEPTNHLDIPAKEALEKALKDYDGTLLFVSHDRYFIQKMAKAIVRIEPDGTQYYPVKYDEIPLQESVEGQLDVKTDIQVRSNPLSLSRLQKQLAKVEELITEKEVELEDARACRFEPEYYHDHAKMKLLDEQIDSIHNELNALLKDWESLHETIQESSQPKPKHV